MGLVPWFRARWIGDLETHVFGLGHFALTSVVFEL